MNMNDMWSALLQVNLLTEVNTGIPQSPVFLAINKRLCLILSLGIKQETYTRLQNVWFMN